MKPYLLIFDFDGNICKTFEPGPLGLDVHTAYEHSVGDIFGEAGLKRYQQIGGLQNRAPTDFVEALLDDRSTREILLDQAHAFFDSRSHQLSGLVPVGKGVMLDNWDYIHPEQVVTELLVRQKLGLLMGQVGQRMHDSDEIWPRLYPGFSSMWESLARQKRENGIPIFTALISSGHDTFIQRTFMEHGIYQPDYLVTEDDVRGRHYPLEVTRRVKPGQLQMALVHREWMKDLGLWDGNFSREAARDLRSSMCYFGDDANKDGLFARGANILFGHFVDNGRNGINPDTQSFQFGHWNDIQILLESHKSDLDSGIPINRLFMENIGGDVELGNYHHGIEEL